MKARVTDDGRFIQIVECTELEHQQMQLSFKKRIGHWRFHPLVKRGVWDGYINFYDKQQRIPLGLWNRLQQECKKYKFKLNFQGSEHLINSDFDPEKFDQWVWDFYEGTQYGKGGKRELRDYQIQACKDTLKFYKSRSELATSAGKTIIMFTIFAYLLEEENLSHHLIIVPNISLVIQTQEAFLEYSEGTSLENNFKIQMFGGGRSKKDKDAHIYIGTYQTLKTFKSDFFDKINCVCVDEAHHTHAKSIKDIILKSYDSKYRYGLSGTMDQGDTVEAMTLDAYLGPIINKVSAKYLIKNNYATKILVKAIYLDYFKDEAKEKLYQLRQRRGKDIEGSKLLDIERKLVIENRTRFKYVCKTISKTTKNSLVLFLDVKHGYGKNVYNYLRENTDKTVFYVDGSTASDAREEYKAEMESGNNKILIASFGTFSTGISINNLHHIFFLESYKSDRLVRQSLGRGMRLLEGKDRVYLWDFIDDFRWGNDNRYKNNYLFRHGSERIKTYKKQGFPYKKYKVNL